NIALILQYQFEKPVLTVALTTVGAKSAVVDILMRMTAAADFGGSPRIAAGLVAAIARQITVCTQQGVAGLFFVIELPHIPGVGRVTVLTLGTQSAFMMIVRFMTADAVGGCPDKLAFQVAAFAG